MNTVYKIMQQASSDSRAPTGIRRHNRSKFSTPLPTIHVGSTCHRKVKSKSENAQQRQPIAGLKPPNGIRRIPDKLLHPHRLAHRKRKRQTRGEDRRDKTIESRAQHFTLVQQHTRSCRLTAAHRIVTGLTRRSTSSLTIHMHMVRLQATTMVSYHHTRPDLNDRNAQQECQYAVS